MNTSRDRTAHALTSAAEFLSIASVFAGAAYFSTAEGLASLVHLFGRLF